MSAIRKEEVYAANLDDAMQVGIERAMRRAAECKQRSSFVENFVHKNPDDWFDATDQNPNIANPDDLD